MLPKKTPLEPGELVVVGDSLGIGVGGALRRAGLAPRVIAIQGSRTSWWADGTRWEDALKGARVAIVSLGSNDIAARQAPSALFHALETRAKALGVRLLWLVPHTALWANQTIVMPGEAVSLAGAQAAADGVHLTTKGYLQAAELVREHL